MTTQNLDEYPITLRDIQEHFSVSNRTARRYGRNKIPAHLRCRKQTFRGELRFKKEAITCIEALIKATRGW
jgi:hypothetical protein